MAGYTQAVQDKAYEQSKERCLACMLLMGSDKTRYGDMLTEIQNDYQKNINSYPATVTSAYALLVNWIPKFVPRAPVLQQGSSFAQGGNIECWGCRKADVLLSECVKPECMKKWKAKQDRRSTKPAAKTGEGQQHLNMNVNADDNGVDAFEIDDDGEDDDSFDIAEYQGYQFHQGSSGKVAKNYILLLDNQSTHDTFYNPVLLRNITKAGGSVIVRANGGQIKYDHTGVLPGYGTVWYNPAGIANILSLGRVEDKGHSVTYSKGQFTVTNKNFKNVTIFQKQGGLFIHQVASREGTAFVQTVEENLAVYTPR
jgi:hypothetical protein